MAAPRSLKSIRWPQYGQRTLTSISTLCLQRAHLYDPAKPAYTSFPSERSIVLSAIRSCGVCGWYAPPANLKPHFLHPQMPVPSRRIAIISQRGQRCAAFEIFSISETLFRTNRPYRGPNRPELPDTFPLAFCVLLAIFSSHRMSLILCHPG
jgi:hypothetical protein